jgi:hypothetical protein
LLLVRLFDLRKLAEAQQIALVLQASYARPPLPAAVGSRGIGRRFVLSSSNRISTKRGKRMSAYLIAEHIITDEAKFHEYRTNVEPMGLSMAVAI